MAADTVTMADSPAVTMPSTHNEAKASRPATLMQRWARSAVLARLGEIRDGCLIIHDGDGTHQVGKNGPVVHIHIHDHATWTVIANEGSVGSGTAYAEGMWTSNDLPGLIRLFVRNRDMLYGIERGIARLVMSLRRVWHKLQRNTRTGSRRNISAHYDLGNDFYRLWLDPTMMYSSALFTRDSMTLHEAQIEKLDRLCELLDLKPSDHLLEIGTGWGGFALHAVKRTGCRVTTTTISREQFTLAQQRVREAGLENNITVLMQDYRDLTGVYDKVISVEMIEAVGHQYYDTYFGTINRLLKPDGLAVIQAITMAERQYETALRDVDFIQRYIFPGATIPSLGAIMTSLGRSSDLDVVAMEDYASHYVETLRRWRESFLAAQQQVMALGHDHYFVRLWEFYLAYC